MKTFNILAIETSCDDTCVALVKDGYIKTNIVISSSEEQSKFGGVVPELAARMHEESIIYAFSQAVDEFNLDDIDLIAYTKNPGLRVCLNIGEALATNLGMLINKPVLPVDHLHAHMFAFYDAPRKQKLAFPFLSLIVSGGHTAIFLVRSVIDIELLNYTVDDAIGEVYDKVARELGLGYPGGPAIDALYHHDNVRLNFLNKFPNPEQQFSFSGLKTAVLNYINQCKQKKCELDVKTIASSFQALAVEIIVAKLRYYLNENRLLDKYKVRYIVVGGGVASNKLLQKRVRDIKEVPTYFPSDKTLCSDNAGMIGIYANLLHKNTD